MGLWCGDDVALLYRKSRGKFFFGSGCKIDLKVALLSVHSYDELVAVTYWKIK